MVACKPVAGVKFNSGIFEGPQALPVLQNSSQLLMTIRPEKFPQYSTLTPGSSAGTHTLPCVHKQIPGTSVSPKPFFVPPSTTWEGILLFLHLENLLLWSMALSTHLHIRIIWVTFKIPNAKHISTHQLNQSLWGGNWHQCFWKALLRIPKYSQSWNHCFKSPIMWALCEAFKVPRPIHNGSCPQGPPS